MTYKRHWLLSWGGTLGGGKDIWANNVRFMNDEIWSGDSVDSGTLEGMLSDFVGDIRTFMQSPDAFISTQVQCLWVKFNEIGPDGRYVDQNNTHARYLSGTTGDNRVITGISGAAVPAFQSVAITTTTSAQRGPGSRGRLFLPQCTATLLQTGLIDPTAQQNLATAAGAFFTALGDEAGVDLTAMKPAVVSNIGEPGPQRAITGVRVGNVPDVISRRKNAIDETYKSAVVA
jgi:hypothetical protein